MSKTIIKEAGIVILLILAVALLLAIIFYDYIPNSKVVPIKLQAYNMPEDIKAELEDGSVNEQNIVRTYYIDNADLDLYESTKEYNKGKANPFADYSENTTSTTGSASTNSTSTSSAKTKSNEVTNANSSKTSTQDTDDGEVYMTTPGKN